MTAKTGGEELAEYKLTRREIAKILGKSTNAIRMSQRQGNKLGLEYREGPNGYLFKFPKDQETNTVNTMSANQVVNHGPDNLETPGVTHKAYTGRSNNYTQSKPKVLNRGATHKGEGNYSNLQFKMANEAKIMASINKKFKSDEHKKVFMEMTDAAFEKSYELSKRVEEKKHDEVAKKSFNDSGHGLGHQIDPKYGGMLNATGLQNVEDKHHSRLRKQKDNDEDIKYVEKYKDVMQLDGSFKRQLVKTNTMDFAAPALGNSSSSFFVGRAVYDDFTTDYDVGRNEIGAEFSQYELDRYSKPEPRTQFKSKVEEDIYRAKKHLLKKNGHWD